MIDLGLASIMHPYYALKNFLPVFSGTYLAPELLTVIIWLMKDIEKNIDEPYFSPKSDVFTMGMIMV